MTQIKQLTAKSFKSFANKTDLIFGDGFNVIIGPNGSGKSSRWDTKILLANGQIRNIGEIVDEALQQTNLILKLDDGVYTPDNKHQLKVLSLDPKSMKIVEKPIASFIKREGEPYLYEIKTKLGRKVVTTGCHPVITFKDKQVVSEIVEKLKVGDFIASPRVLPHINKEGGNPLFTINAEFSRFLGYFTGDGCLMETSNRIDFVNMDPELIEDYTHLIKKLGLKCGISQRNNSKVITIYSYSKEFAKKLALFLNHYYKKEKKHIPEEILFSPYLCDFLGSLFDCDGSVRKDNPTFEYATMSETLANQVHLGLLQYGILSTKKTKSKYASNTINKTRKDYYYIYIRGRENLQRLKETIPFRCNHKRERLSKLIEKPLNINPNKDLLPKKINSIVKQTKELLCMSYKPLRKEYPRLAAYIENRCCPTRHGLEEILPLFVSKLEKFECLLENLKLEQSHLVSCVQEIGMSERSVSLAIGLQGQIISSQWKPGKFKARERNLRKLHEFLRSELEQRILWVKENIQILDTLAHSDIYWDEIESIEKVKGEEFVYDLCIPEHHNFIGNGLFVHNSNVMDALTFVLGKSSAKGMRAEKSANLIYNGGKKGSPSKEAEVSIVFSNDNQEFPLEDKEVVVTRIVKQNGTSIYKLNGKTKTKQEIVDVLANGRVDPDGHNIILQGDIVHLMEMKPELRRELVEEIAGISIYDDKKDKALHELEKVQERLTEVDIILTEREAHLRELKKERDDAQHYKELQEKIKDNKATYVHMQIKKKEEKKNEIESKINEHERRLKVIEDLVKEIKEIITKKREEIKSINQEIEEKGEKEQLALREEISFLKEKVITQTSRLDVIENELKKIVERKQQLAHSTQETLEKIKGLSEQKKQLNNTLQETYLQEEKQLREIRRYKEANGIEKFGDVGNQLNQMESSLEEKNSSFLHLQEEEQSFVRELDKVTFNLEAIDDKISKFTDKEGGEKLKHLRNQFKEVTKELGKVVNEDSAYAAQLGKARSKLYSMQEELARLSITQAGIKEAAGGDLAIRKVMELKGKGVYGTIAELGEVSKTYSLALEVAAGNRVNSIVVNDEAVGAKCIALLKEHKLGVATFLPLTTIKPRTVEAEAMRLKGEKGVFGLALDLISYDKKFDSIFKYVLGSTLVVEDITVARRIGIGRARMVTLDGDLMEPSGAMVGGYRRAMSGKFHQKEVSGKINELEEEVERLRKIITTLEAKRNENESSLVMLREQKAGLEGEIIRVEKSFGVEGDVGEIREEKRILVEKQKQISQEIRRIGTEKILIEKELVRVKRDRDVLRDKLTSNPGVVEGLTVLEEKKSQFREESIRIKSEIKQIDHQTSLLGEETEKITHIIKEHDKEKLAFLEEKHTLNDTMVTHTRELKEKQKLEQAFYGKFKSLALKRNKLEEESVKKEGDIGEEEEKYKVIESKKHELSLIRAKFVAEMEGLQREFEDYKEGKIRRNITFEELKKEIDDCDAILRKMGSVNMRALEIYDDVKKEYEQLVEKTSKLKEEKEVVLSTMHEIEQQKLIVFMKTFKDLEKNFKEIFSTLSDKGEAQLVLETPESPLEGGLDIRVRITGNKFLDIRGLSGGEKTMTALAFIFAVQEFNPAPFYLLDEVDAALDKHNSDKLSKLIAKYAGGAQYIVISHNDYVITEAQQVYGVSMQEGVSKVISLKI